MPRTLPWLTGGETRDTAPRKRATKPQGSNSDHDRTPKTSKKAAADFTKSDILRSSSPPAQSIRRCPSEEYLIEGFDNDDIYMMVEDEFYAVAQRFTQHLHYAEYVRRTKEVKSQNAARIRDIARPTDGVTPMSKDTKKKKEAEALSARQKAGLEQIEYGSKGEAADEEGADDEDDDDSWAGTSLKDLMTSPRRVRSLVGTPGARRIKSSTRAAAGYAQTSQNATGLLSSSPLGRREQVAVADKTTSEDDDDLDVQPTATFKRTVHDITPKAEPRDEKPNTSSSITPTMSISTNFIEKPETKTKQTPSINARNQNQNLSVSNPQKKLLFDDFDELPEPKPNDVSMQEQKTKSLSSSISRTPTGSRSGSGSNLESKKSRLNEVPTFLL